MHTEGPGIWRENNEAMHEKFKEKKDNKKFEDTIKIDELTPEKQAEIVQEFRTKMQKREYSGKEVSL